MKKHLKQLGIMLLSMFVLSACNSDDDGTTTSTQNKLMGKWALVKLIDGVYQEDYPEDCTSIFDFEKNKLYGEDYSNRDEQGNTIPCKLLDKIEFDYTFNENDKSIKLTYVSSLLPYDGNSNINLKVEFIDDNNLRLVNVDEGTPTLILKKK